LAAPYEAVWLFISATKSGPAINSAREQVGVGPIHGSAEMLEAVGRAGRASDESERCASWLVGLPILNIGERK
jgi:hypothetical protein